MTLSRSASTSAGCVTGRKHTECSAAPSCKVGTRFTLAREGRGGGGGCVEGGCETTARSRLKEAEMVDELKCPDSGCETSVGGRPIRMLSLNEPCLPLSGSEAVKKNEWF